MKRIVAVLLLIILFAFPSFAKGTNFETYDIPSSEKEELMNKCDIQKIEDFDGVLGFDSFDVNENGDILLVYYESTMKLFAFDKNFDFLYGFDTNIDLPGGAEWNNENIIFYFNRSYLAHEIDKSGNLLDIKKVENIGNSYLFDTEKTVNGTTYKSEKSFFLSSTYAKITKIDADGVETVIFDVSKENLTGNLILFSAITVFCVSIITGMTIYTKRSIQENRRQKKLWDNSKPL